MRRTVSVGILGLFLLACGSESGGGGGGRAGGGSGGDGASGGTGGAGGAGGVEAGAALSLPGHEGETIAVPLHGHVGVRVRVDSRRAVAGPLRILLEGELPPGVWAGTTADAAPGSFEGLELEGGEEEAVLYFHAGADVETLDDAVDLRLRGSGEGWEEVLAARLQVSALVTTTRDEGPGSLRDMIESAPAIQERPTIGFAPWIFSSREGAHHITLQSSLRITESLTIRGPLHDDRPLVAIDGGERIRLVEVGTEEMVAAGETLDVRLVGLRFQNGKVVGAGGGCVLNHLPLRLEEVVFAGCRAETGGPDMYEGMGGGLLGAWPKGSVEIIGSRFEGNRARRGAAAFLNAKVVIEDTSFVENEAEFIGGALSIGTQEEVSIAVSHFIRNAARVGGALVFDGDSLIVNDSHFIGNAAVREDGGGGGAIYLETGPDDTVYILDSIFQNNAGKPKGGAILNSRARLLVERSQFLENEAHAVIGDTKPSLGGAISTKSEGDNLIVRDTVFKGNQAGRGGALHVDGKLLMERCSVIENVSEGWAGGIDLVAAANATIENSTIAGNEALVVGGLYVHDGANAELTYVTITGNRATGAGNEDGSLDRPGPVGGLALANAELKMGRCIVAGNEATGDTTRDIWVEPRIDRVATFESKGYNLVGDTHGSAKLLAPNPLLRPEAGDLAGNQTAPAGVLDPRLEALREVAPRAWVAMPREASDAIDRIPAAQCASASQLDQREARRPSGEGCDAGAVER